MSIVPSAAPWQVILVVSPERSSGLSGPLISFNGLVFVAPLASVIVIEYSPAVRFVKVYVRSDILSNDCV